MASIRTRINADKTKTYQVTVRVVGQEPMRRSFSDREQAKRWGEVTTVVARQSVLPIADTKGYRKIKLGDAIDDYIASGQCERTAKIHLSTVKKHDGFALLGAMNKQFAVDYVATMKKTNSQRGKPFAMTTISRQFDAIRSLITHHAELKGVEPPISPFKKKTLGKGWEVRRTRLMEDFEYPLIKDEMATRRQKSHWPLLLDLAIETGAHQEEMILATASEFSLERRVWTIPAEHTKANTLRQVPLSRKATAIVSELLNLLAQARSKAIALSSKKPMPHRVFHVFASASSISTNWRKMMNKIGIEDLHFHDLRHTAVTRMVLHKPNLTVKQIMLIVGHTSEEMTNSYTHLRGDPSLVAAME